MTFHLVLSHFSVLNRWGLIWILVKISEARIRYRNFSRIFACKVFSAGLSILIIKTSRNSRCWVKWAFRLSLGCLFRRYSVFYNLKILSIVIRYDLGISIILVKSLIRILPWDPWLPRCSKNLARSCQDSQDASKRVNPGCYSQALLSSSFSPKYFSGIFSEISFSTHQTRQNLEQQSDGVVSLHAKLISVHIITPQFISPHVHFTPHFNFLISVLDYLQYPHQHKSAFKQ